MKNLGIMPPVSYKLTDEQMNKVLLEKISYKQRLESVYIPLILTEVATQWIEYLINVLASHKLSSTKKISRNLKECIESYRQENKNKMGIPLAFLISRESLSLYKILKQHLQIAQFSYSQELFKTAQKSLAGSTCEVLSICYVAKQLIGYIIVYERDFNKLIQEKIGSSYIYTASDNEHCVYMLKQINEMIRKFGGTDSLDSQNIQMSYTIFKNKVSMIDVCRISKECNESLRC